MKTILIVFVLSLTVSFAAFGQTPKTAEDYNNRGLERQAKGDIAGAIEDYTTAITHAGRPEHLTVFYFNRANARVAKEDWDGAIADYAKSIEFAPANPD